MGNCIRIRNHADCKVCDRSQSVLTEAARPRPTGPRRLCVPPASRRRKLQESTSPDGPIVLHSNLRQQPRRKHSGLSESLYRSEVLRSVSIGIASQPNESGTNQDSYYVYADPYVKLVGLFDGSGIRGAEFSYVLQQQLPQEVLARYAGSLGDALEESLDSVQADSEASSSIALGLVQPHKLELVVAGTSHIVLGQKMKSKHRVWPTSLSGTTAPFTGGKLCPSVYTLEDWKPLDYLIVCSEGVRTQTTDQELVDAASVFGPECNLAAEHIVAAAKRRWVRTAGTVPDDLTAIVVWLA